MDKNVYKVGLTSLVLVIIFYIIAIVGKETLPELTIIALIFILPLVVVSAGAFIIGYIESGKVSRALWSGVVFTVLIYVATELLAFPFGEQKFVARMKNYSSANTGITASLGGSVRGSIHLSIIWLLILGIVFALVGFSINKKHHVK